LVRWFAQAAGAEAQRKAGGAVLEVRAFQTETDAVGQTHQPDVEIGDMLSIHDFAGRAEVNGRGRSGLALRRF
jgi:hypothetical protein